MTAAVRAWARDNGHEVGQRGRIGADILAAYAASISEPAVTEYSLKGSDGAIASCGCGRRWGGLAECHCTVCHQHFNSINSFDAHGPGPCLDAATATHPQRNKKGQRHKYGGRHIFDRRESRFGATWVLAGYGPVPEHWVEQ